MYYDENSLMVKCHFLRDNSDIDELEYCPRFLDSKDKRVLLESLAVEMEIFSEKLYEFVGDHSDLDFSPYFDYFYRPLAKALRRADSNLYIKQHEDSFI